VWGAREPLALSSPKAAGCEEGEERH
jgi:hypothetical protein